MSILDTLSGELGAYNAASEGLEALYRQSDDVLAQLKQIEADLEREASLEADLAKVTNEWYKGSISGLKGYNSAINKFNKNVVNHPKFKMDIDDAYTYPLDMANYPLVPLAEALHATEVANKQQLTRLIILQLLKSGHCDIVPELVDELDPEGPPMNPEALSQFAELKEMVDAVVKHHDLSLVLAWFTQHPLEALETALRAIEFKFHVLQFVLLLSDPAGMAAANLMAAYSYAQKHFAKFFVDHANEISSLMMLLVYDTSPAHGALPRFFGKLQKSRNSRINSALPPETVFVTSILMCFDDIHAHHEVFVTLAHEFTLEFCRQLGLLDDSSLFQAVLAGFVYLPSFYKYNLLQRKLGKAPLADAANQLITLESGEKVASLSFDLPFQLADNPRFLWRFHPIFICPVSKEQLMPITDGPEAPTTSNPVVVLDHCQHVALKDSVWQLLKKGQDTFKCHYCYKKHKFADVKDAYFIDL